jgi:hypothetical protein
MILVEFFAFQGKVIIKTFPTIPNPTALSRTFVRMTNACNILSREDRFQFCGRMLLANRTIERN